MGRHHSQIPRVDWWVERCEGAPHAGVSWLVLLVDFEISTGGVVRNADQLHLDTTRLLRRESEDKELVNMFQHEVTCAVAVLYARDVNQLFQAANGGRARLSGTRINASVACVQTLPCWDAPRHVGVLAAMPSFRSEESRWIARWPVSPTSRCSAPRGD